MHVTKNPPTLIGVMTYFVNLCISLCLFWAKYFVFIWLHKTLSFIENFIPFGPPCSSTGRAFIHLTKFTEYIGAKPKITAKDINMEAPSTHFDKMLLLREKLIHLFDDNLSLLHPKPFHAKNFKIEPLKILDIENEKSYFITTTNNNTSCKGTVLYFHGGGFMCGESTTYANMLSPWLHENNFDCLVVDYGLCPYYTPEEIAVQGRKAFNYLVNERSINPKSIVCAGESAGANLSIQVVRELVLEGNNDKLPAGLVLLSPWVDLTLSSNSWKSSGTDIVLTDNMCRLGEKLEIFSQEQSRQYSPVYMDLSDFPPCFVSWGEHERLSDECTMLCERLTDCGVQVTQDPHKGMFHAFSLFHKYIQEGKLSFDRAASFIRKNIR